MISVVIPVYEAQAFLVELTARLDAVLKKLGQEFEIIYVEDFSRDGSWAMIEDLSKQYPHLKGYKLSRNFGQHYAIFYGLDFCRGDWVVVMDCDLQDQPEEIVNLYNKVLEGYDAVLASRQVRRDGVMKRFFSKAFYRLLTYLTDTPHDPTIASFGIYNRKVIQQIRNMPERIRYFPTMVRWVGFRTFTLNVEHKARGSGKSGYTFGRYLRLALDIMLANSDKPMRLTIRFGFSIAFLAFAYTVFVIFKWLNGDIVVLGYSSLIISIWFLAGCILMTLGVVGLYVGKYLRMLSEDHCI